MESMVNTIMESQITMQFFNFMIIVGIFAIGDYLGIITKAKLSAVFVALVIFLVGFLTGILPPQIVEFAGLTTFANLAGALVVFHMGTMINLQQLRQEWRTVVTAVLSMIVVALAIFAIIPVIGYENAIVAIPVLNGGLISTKIMVDAATGAGLAVAAALGTVLYAIQKFAGSYPASFFGVREAKEVLAEHRANKDAEIDGEKEKQQVRHTFAQKYNKYFTDFTCIALAAFFAFLSTALGVLTPVNYSIWALLFGAVFGYFGIVPLRILEKGKVSGLLTMLVFASIIPSLAKITWDQLSTLGFVSILCLVVAVIALIVVFYFLPLWKISKSRNLAVGIAMGQLLGFPATFLISNEIAKAVTDDEEEQEVVLNRIMPAYVVSGLATVTTLSIVVAGIFSNFI